MQNAVIYQPVQIEYLKKTSDLFSEQQLADSFVLIFHLKGNGYISIGTNTNPLQKRHFMFVRLTRPLALRQQPMDI